MSIFDYKDFLDELGVTLYMMLNKHKETEVGALSSYTLSNGYLMNGNTLNINNFSGSEQLEHTYFS